MLEAAVVVGNDSGPMHLAVALGRPVVALYGPTSPARTGPYDPSTRRGATGRGNVLLIRTTSECAPCFRPDCPDSDCMRDISVDAVFEAVHDLLGRKP
jgi:ADP-heptose:LPS heptosyltransferase